MRDQTYVSIRELSARSGLSEGMIRRNLAEIPHRIEAKRREVFVSVEGFHAWMESHKIPARIPGMPGFLPVGSLPAPSCSTKLDLAVLTQTPCIYFLTLNDLVVYVGQTICLAARIGQHSKEKAGQFDGAAYVTCEPDELDALEQKYIAEYKPALNLAGKELCKAGQ